MKIFPFHRYLLLALAGLLVAGCNRESKLNRSLQRADDFFKNGKFESARIEYQNVLQLDPKHTTALRQLSRIWMERGASISAAPYIQQLLRLNPEDREAQEAALKVAQSAGQLEIAQQIAVRLLTHSPNHAEAIVILTDVARGEKDLAFARQALKNFGEQGSAAFHRASANLAFHQGDIAGAKSALLRAVASEPKSVDAHVALGSFYSLTKDTAAAEEQFKLASEAAPARSMARLRYLESKAQTVAVSEAIEELKKLTNEAPDFFPAWRCLAQITAVQGKHDEAQAFLENIFKLDPWNVEARVLRAQILIAQGETAKGIAELERLTEKFPNLASPPYELGRAHLRNKDAAKAQVALKNAIKRNPDHDLATLLWAGLALRSGDAQAVVLAMGDLLSKRPGLEDAQMMLIDALGALGRLDDIINIMRESIRVAPQRAQTHYLLGMVLLRKGKPEEARPAFEKALELAPNSAPALAELVNLDLREGKIGDAKKRVEGKLLTSPESGMLHLLAAHVYAGEGRWDETEAAAWKAVERGMSGRESHLLITRSYFARKDTNLRSRIETLLAKRPNDASALAVAGDVYGQLKEFTRAADAYEKCLLRKPDTLIALNNLSYLYAERLNKPERALELATKARELDPNSPEVADTLGWILFNRREYARALELLKESVARAPANPEIQFHYARANQMMGHAEVARSAFAKAAASKADFEGKAQIDEFIAQLGQKVGAP